MKKLFVLAAASLLSFTACTSDNDASNSSESSLILPKSFTVTSGSNPSNSQHATITYNGNKIVKMTYDDGRKMNFFYTGDLITKMESIVIESGETKIGIREFAYTDGKMTLSTGTATTSAGNEVDTDKMGFTHNSDGTVLVTKYYTDDNGKEISYPIVRLTVYNGNLTKFEGLDPNTGSVDYTKISEYDNKNTVYKNVLGMDKLNVFGFFGSGINNRTKETSDDGFSFIRSYKYNDSGYPTEVILSNSEGYLYDTTTYVY